VLLLADTRADLSNERTNNQILQQDVDNGFRNLGALADQVESLGGEPVVDPGNIQGIPGATGAVGPKGEKVLHVEEIQSDWHQQGRKKGYKTPEIEARRKELEELAAPYMDGSRPMPPELRKEIEALPPMDGVPDAPFKKNWHELAMKRVLNYAAENGYDRVAITPGAEQASRYNLAKQIDKVEYTEGGALYAWDKNGNEVLRKQVPEGEVEDYIGKDLTQKLFSADKDKFNSRALVGADLEVGGEGMKGFYDKMLPDYLNSYGKKYGVQVTPFDIVTHPETSTPQIAAPGIGHFPDPIVEPAKTAPVHGFEITPQMREEITGKGMPLYQQIGIPAGGAAAGAGALDQEEQGFADGGVVRAAAGGEFDTDPDMADGGLRVQGTAFKKGGRVHLSQNPDTMLLDLMSRS
jgi:hypothetical protein